MRRFARRQQIPLQFGVLWQVHRGLVRLSCAGEGNTSLLVGLAGPTAVFGANLSTLAGYRAVALSYVELTCHPAAEFESRSLARLISQRLGQTESLLAIARHRFVEKRLCELLLLLKELVGLPTTGGVRLEVRLLHEDFADAIGTSRVTITKLLKKLCQQHKLDVDRKHHLVLLDGHWSPSFSAANGPVP